MIKSTATQPQTLTSGLISRADVQRYAIFFALALVFVVSAAISDTFIQPRNLMNIGRQISVNGILAVGMTAVILTAGIDLSVGSLLAFMGVVIALLLEQTAWPVAIALTLLAGLVVGLIHGYVIARMEIPPFIVTLAGLTIYRGASLVLTDAAAVPIAEPLFQVIGQSMMPTAISLAAISLIVLYAIWRLLTRRNGSMAQRVVGVIVVLLFWIGLGYLIVTAQGIPYPVVCFVLIAIVGNWVLSRTTFGRHLYAIGGNKEAARLSGVKVEKLLIIVYTLMTLLATVAAILLAARLSSGTPRVGVSGELDAIAAVIIGGTSLSGGAGTIGGSVIGVLLIGVINNLLSLMNVDSNVQLIIKGFIILGAVIIDQSARKR